MNNSRCTNDGSQLGFPQVQTYETVISPSESEGVIAALHAVQNAIGAVFYDMGGRTLSIMEEIPLTDLKSDIEQLLRQSSVKEVLISAMDPSMGGDMIKDLGYHVKELPSKHFSIAMENLVVSHNQRGNRHHILRTIPVEEGQSLACANALLSYICQHTDPDATDPYLYNEMCPLSLEIFSMLNAVEYFAKAENSLIRDQLRACLKLLSNIEYTIGRMKTTSNLSDWRRFLGFSDFNTENYQIASVIELRVLDEISTTIENTIDFTNSKQEGTIVINIGIDNQQWLDEMKQKYSTLGDLLCEVVKDISSSVPPFIAEVLDVVYLPQLGYLITLPNEIAPSSLHANEFQFQFSAADTNYYKNSNTRDREIEIFQQLVTELLRNENALLRVSAATADLDRHPLEELLMGTFIQNDTFLGYSESNTPSVQSRYWPCEQNAGHNSGAEVNIVMLLSAPNQSGKSVYLQQVTLIVYLAHIGSFIPASSAKIGLTDMIVTRMQTLETVSKAKSAFQIDLQEILFCLQYATSRSLILLDEFGKVGSCDGAALLCAILEHFIKKQNGCPKVLAATHFHELIEGGILSSSLTIAYYTMDIIYEEQLLDQYTSIEEIGKQGPTFLYRVVPGRRPGRSFAIWCAKNAMVPQRTLSRATEILSILLKQGFLPQEMTAFQKREIEYSENMIRTLVTTDTRETSAEELRQFLHSLN
ncbi:muts domain V-domain-containing protein [Umbelopsis sp. PMI_123]|nr:muts domain V-domain-containing protein [Umbelopsis sp. PMI_123]